MLVLKLNDWRVQALRRTHPRLVHAKTLARGTFGAVFTTPNPDRVLKLTVDKSHRDYLVDGLSPEGVYKPIVTEDFNEVGETTEGDTLYLFEMERLQHLKRGTRNGLLAHRITRYVDSHGRCPSEPVKDWGLTPDLLNFMSSLNKFADNFCYRRDFHWKNFMERPSDGTLVFSDPVFDQEMHLRKLTIHSNRARRFMH